jgi:hypothetical protein
MPYLHRCDVEVTVEKYTSSFFPTVLIQIPPFTMAVTLPAGSVDFLTNEEFPL